MDRLDRLLIDELQNDFPLAARPFSELGRRLDETEEEALRRTRRLAKSGVLLRIAALFSPVVVGWSSTLVGIRVEPGLEARLACEAAEIPWVTHLYERDDEWRLWAALVAPSLDAIRETLARLSGAPGVAAVAELPAVRTYKVRATFPVSVERKPRREGRPSRVCGDDARMLAGLSAGLCLVEEPFAEAAARLGVSQEELLARLAALRQTGALRRVGAVVEGSRLGLAHGALAALRVAGAIDEAGLALACLPGVTHCYRRRPHALFPFELFAMVHAASDDELAALAGTIEATAGEAVSVEKLRFMRTARRWVRRPPAYGGAFG